MFTVQAICLYTGSKTLKAAENVEIRQFYIKFQFYSFSQFMKRSYKSLFLQSSELSCDFPCMKDILCMNMIQASQKKKRNNGNNFIPKATKKLIKSLRIRRTWEFINITGQMRVNIVSIITTRLFFNSKIACILHHNKYFHRIRLILTSQTPNILLPISHH